MKKQILTLALLISNLILFAQVGSWVNKYAFSEEIGRPNISIIDDDIIWVGCQKNTDNTFKVIKTIDGGASWIETNTGIADQLGFAAASNDLAWITTYTEVYKTSDGGINWNLQLSGLGFANNIHFFDTNNGVVFGDPVSGEFEIFTTSNSGNTWTQVSASDIPDSLAGEWGLSPIYDTYEDTIWFMTNKGRIYKSNDKGQMWTVVDTPYDSNSIVEIKDENTAWLIKGTELWETVNAGDTWAPITYTGTLSDGWGFTYVPGTESTLLTDGASSNYSEDGGQNWNEIALAELLSDTDATNINSIWAVSGTTIYKNGDVPAIEKQALLDLYNATNGINWTTNTNWNGTSPVATWHGITVENGSVTKIDLNFNNLVGTIPSSIGDLSELTELSLYTNDLNGEVPTDLWTLSNLQYLYLGAQESKNLTMTGGIPSAISNMQDLIMLNLKEIPLSLPLQPELFNLPNLILLSIGNCGLTGALPAELAGIHDVYVNGNSFEGGIPSEIINATGNNNLDLRDCFFDFTDLEPLVITANYTNLNYSPQRTKDTEEELYNLPGDDITLEVDDSGIEKSSNTQTRSNVFQWFKDEVAISGANLNTFTITNAQSSDSGVYYCEITNSLLPDLIIRRANITLSVNSTNSIEDLLSPNITIYPNPTNDYLYIKTKDDTNINYTSIYDITGRLLFKGNKDVIDLKSLNKGIYTLKIIDTNANVFSMQIIKN